MAWLLLLAAGVAVSWGSHAAAQASIDISGDWSVTVGGGINSTCLTRFTQHGTNLSATTDCAGLGSGTFSGTIDLATGQFHLSGAINFGGNAGVPVELQVEGTASSSNAMSGRWSALSMFSGTFTGTRGGEGPGAIDPAGSWRMEFVGDETKSCPVDIDRSGADLSASVDCGEAGSGTLIGTSSRRGFVLAGALFGSPLELIAHASEDANAFSGSWRGPSGDQSGTVIGVRRLGRSGGVTLTGDWDATFTGGFFGTCRSAIQQTGADLFAAIDCDLAGPETLTGSLDPKTGTFHLDGLFHGGGALLGVVTRDGSLTGAWAVPFMGLSGTFVSSRMKEMPSLIDLSGDWDIAFAGSRSASCRAEIAQTLGDLSASLTCQELGSGAFTGTLNPFTRDLTLHGPLGDLELSLDGRASEDAASVQGAWTASTAHTPEKSAPLVFGCFIGRRAGVDAPLRCEPPRTYPTAQMGDGPNGILKGGLSSQPTPESDALGVSAAPREGVTESGRWGITALGGLGIGLFALAVWRLRLQR